MSLSFPDFAARAFQPAAGDPERRATSQAVSHRTWDTPEGVPVRSLYSAADTAGLDFINDFPGLAPFGRGHYPTMFAQQPWTIRQYAGFSTAEDSNAF